MLAATGLDSLTLVVTQEIHVRAPIETTFASLLAQIGRQNETPDGAPLPMVLEAWPGGRWFRDLGGDNGHLWGFVQSIKRPTLLEITGPLFMSNPALNNVQYRLSEVEDGTRLVFHHRALGLIEDDHRKGLSAGWAPLHERIRRAAEAESGR